MRSTKTIALFFLLASCSAQPAYAATLPDRHRAAVVDAANVIPDAEEQALNDKLVEWEHRTGHQIVVATIPTLNGMDITDFGVQLGRTWQLGRAGVNDGAILILAPHERKVRIEVGYGLEPALTDALTSEIIRTGIVPRLKAGDTVGALLAGAEDMMTAVNAYDTPEQVKADDGKAQHPAGSWWWLFGLLAMPAGAVPIILSRRRRKQQAEAAARRPVITKTANFAPRPPVGDAFIATPRKRYQPTTARAAATPTPTPTKRSEDRSSSAAAAVAASSYDYSSSYSPPSPSYDSSSSSSSGGFDSGGGSFGGGGSDSSY